MPHFLVEIRIFDMKLSINPCPLGFVGNWSRIKKYLRRNIAYLLFDLYKSFDFILM